MERAKAVKQFSAKAVKRFLSKLSNVFCQSCQIVFIQSCFFHCFYQACCQAARLTTAGNLNGGQWPIGDDAASDNSRRFGNNEVLRSTASVTGAKAEYVCSGSRMQSQLGLGRNRLGRRFPSLSRPLLVLPHMTHFTGGLATGFCPRLARLKD